MSRKPLEIDCAAGSQLRDSQGEMLSVEGCDISALEDGTAKWTDNHGKGFFNNIGRITHGKKIFKAEDCEDDRQRYYWEKIKAPYIYARGFLYSDDDHPNARAAAAVVRNIHRTDCPLKMKASVEGGVVSRGLKDPTFLAKTKLSGVALTLTPANQATLVEPLNLDKSNQTSWEADSILIKSVMHLAQTNVPSFRHITRDASAEKIENNMNRIMATLGNEVVMSLKQELVKDSLESKIAENIFRINEMVCTEAECLRKSKWIDEEMGKGELDPKLGYTFSHEHHDLGDGEMLTHVRAHHPSGMVAGEALFNHRPNKMLEAEGVKIHPEHQRLGLGTAIYNHAQKVTNKPIMPSTDQTAAGKAFWSGTKGNFGKALTAGYGGAGAPTSMSGGAVLQSESQEVGPKVLTFITCDNCGKEQVYGKYQVKCREPECGKAFSMAKLEKFFRLQKSKQNTPEEQAKIDDFINRQAKGQVPHAIQGTGTKGHLPPAMEGTFHNQGATTSGKIVNKRVSFKNQKTNEWGHASHPQQEQHHWAWDHKTKKWNHIRTSYGSPNR